MLEFSSRGDFRSTMSFLDRIKRVDPRPQLEAAGKKGVSALAAATPRESGETASSWSYEVESNGKNATISWTNSHVEGGVPIAIILQYGHGTGTGGYVAGRDYINPALKPIFDKIADDVWKAVKSA